MRKSLRGQPGKILTTTDARGVEIDQMGENREEPVAGKNLKISLDVDLQEFAAAGGHFEGDGRKTGRDESPYLLMNPQNGEILCLC